MSLKVRTNGVVEYEKCFAIQNIRMRYELRYATIFVGETE